MNLKDRNDELLHLRKEKSERGEIIQTPRHIGTLSSDDVRKIEPFPISYESAEALAQEVARKVKVPYTTLDEMDLSNPRIKRIVDDIRTRWIQAYLSRQGTALVLLGPAGTGKTHIARSIYHGVRVGPVQEPGEPDISVPYGRFMSETDLLYAFQPQQEVGGIWVADGAHICRGTNLIIIDDVGRGQGIQYVASADQMSEIRARYFKLFDYAQPHGVSVVITTNMNITALADYLGEANWSRLRGAAQPKFIYDLRGLPDYRIAGKTP